MHGRISAREVRDRRTLFYMPPKFLWHIKTVLRFDVPGWVHVICLLILVDLSPIDVDFLGGVLYNKL